MARNAEKAMFSPTEPRTVVELSGLWTTLARWRAAHLEQDGERVKVRRPYLASECTDLKQAEKWRMQIIREIARKVSQIQNAGLGEFRIRDLNDEINKLMREKGHWEVQIRELGGPDYAAIGPRMLDNEGKEVPGNRGYKYFGAARQLPGVRELFEQAVPAPARKTRGELMKCIDAYYYGYRDDDDNILIPLEAVAQELATEKALAEWKIKKESQMEDEEVEAEEELYLDPEESSDSIPKSKPACSVSDLNEPEDERRDKFIAYVPVPSQKDVERALLERRKQELLNRLHIIDLDDPDEATMSVDEQEKNSKETESMQQET